MEVGVRVEEGSIEKGLVKGEGRKGKKERRVVSMSVRVKPTNE